MTSLTGPLRQPLFDGPLDIVGDVHGEFETLLTLCRHLGYDEEGVHSEGRRLVFVGDLTDRGPDSPAVVDYVARLRDRRRAQAVLGNHDLNLLLGLRKFDNGWFYGEPFHSNGQLVPQRLADHAIRSRVLDVLGTFPLVLERHDVRVIHACWDDLMLERVGTSHDVVTTYESHREEIAGRLVATPPGDEVEGELIHQNENPVKRLTSGLEERAPAPYERGGRLRTVQRVSWWRNYRARPLCIFGHYSIPHGQCRGSASSFCIDYGVGYRWRERARGVTEDFQQRLAAYRFPEHEIVFDNGDRLAADVARQPV